MLSVLVRLIGLLSLAASFAWLIVDGTASIAKSALVVTPLSSPLAGKLAAMRTAIVKLSPVLWDPVATDLLAGPVWAWLALVGLMLIWVARRRRPAIGGLARS